MVRSNPSGEPGLGVKSLTSPAIADSPRNVPQYSLPRGMLAGRATDSGVKGRKARLQYPTPNSQQPKKGGVRVGGKAPNPKGEQPNVWLRRLNGS